MLRRALIGVSCSLFFLCDVIASPLDAVAAFQQLHASTLTEKTCERTYARAPQQFTFCAKELRNPGNAPYMMWHLDTAPEQPPRGVVILLHGLSDSPFYMGSIAQTAYQAGYHVVVGLLPGHGLRNGATEVLHDNTLRAIWRNYTDALVATAAHLSDKIVVGGFSTGGALATDFVLRNPGSVQGLLLFSGALALPDNAETLSKIPFAKAISKWMDGDYPQQGEAPYDNPYKYPDISSHAALILLDIIRNIRQALNESTGLKMPMFVAHSQADSVTPIEGVRGLLSFSVAEHTVVEIAESMDVCHAAVPLTTAQVRQINVKDPNPLVNCDSPEANPVHAQMAAMLDFYLRSLGVPSVDRDGVHPT